MRWVSTSRPGSARLAGYARHRLSAAVLAAVLAIVGTATAWNLQGWPGRVNDDEGTYVAEAWAILYQHTLSHYSYWYDHPPLGWAQIALFAWVTDGFNRVASAVFAGREFMWCVTLACCALLYALCRRIGMHRATSAAATLLFGLSPSAQFWHRLVSLDNIETMWVLAALVAATSPRRGWGPACRAGACAGIAVLSKETAVILVPVIAWVLWQRSGQSTDTAAGRAAADPAAPARDDGGAAAAEVPEAAAVVAEDPAVTRSPIAARTLSMGVFAGTCCLVVALWPLYALWRGELPLLWSTLRWQFSARQGSGSLLDSGSQTYAMVHGWVAGDPWLQLAGFFAALLTLFSRRLRPFAVALLLQVAVLIHGGYLPFFYVTAILPFAALAIGGAADMLWYRVDQGRADRVGRADRADRADRWGRWGRADRWAPYVGRAIVTLAALTYVIHVGPEWVSGLSQNVKTNGAASYLTAASWIERHVPRNATIVVDDYLWVDLKRHGMNPLWTWKIDSQTAPDGWRSIRYVIELQSPGTLPAIPVLRDALAHSVQVADFGGGLTARKVIGVG